MVAGVPGNGTDGVTTVTIGGTPTGGTFYLGCGGFVTGAITWSNVNATLVAAIDAALEALASIGTGGVTTAATTLTAGIGALTCTYAGTNAKRRKPPVVVVRSELTGTNPTIAAVETTPGVDAYGIGLPLDAVVVNGATGLGYKNTGTAANPVWAAF
jgi:hypothetical protein